MGVRLGELPALCSSPGNPRSAAFFLCTSFMWTNPATEVSNLLAPAILVLSGAAMHEGQWRRLTTALDHLQQLHFPQAGSNVEFHASDLRSGRGLYRDLPVAKRNRIMNEVYGVIGNTRQGLTLFASVIHKDALMYKYQGQVEPYDRAFEGLCTMFNYFLRRVQKNTGNVLKGVVVFDESRPSLSKQIRSLLAQFQAGDSVG